VASPVVAEQSKRFFKSGVGEYAEGDRFLGIRVPQLRTYAKQFAGLTRRETRTLLDSPIHEERLLALFILVTQYVRGEEREQESIYRLYLASKQQVNNWDLVDSSAHLIVGAHLENRSRQPLYGLARSRNLWQRRIAMIATAWFIRRQDYADALGVARVLVNDEEDLIHKAVGWMLREIGDRDGAVERRFLDAHAATMPRTMLRYAIEKFPAAERQRYLRFAKRI
jgi:3-methyladenine DNA glycosylase AlkD